jgi:hypothetical protein
MAKSKSSKSKVDFKQILIAKGEYIAMGTAGLFLAVLLMWAASRWSSAKDPDKISKELLTKAQNVQSSISNPNVEITPEMLGEGQLPDWLTKKFEYRRVAVSHFATKGPLFDPIAKPDTKKENPIVWPLVNYQVDLVRGGMRGYDILLEADKEPLIAVIVAKKINEQDAEKVKEFTRTVKGRGQQGHKAAQNLAGGRPPGMGGGRPGGGSGFPPGGGRPGGGSGFPPGGMPPGAGVPPGGMGPGEGDFGGSSFGGYGSYAGMQGGFNANAQRVEKSLEYIPLKELDKAIEKGKVPAMTVIPLRMVTVHAEVPYEKQVEEIKRALRLPSDEAAKAWGPIYDGYEVQRKVSVMGPNGPEVWEDWADYKFEDKYIERVNSRKLADNFEDGYMSYFIRYDMALALPLPQLVPELGGYPKITLENINKTVAELKKANEPPITTSDLLKRLSNRPPRDQLYQPQTGQGTGAAAFYGEGGFGGPKMEGPAGTGGMPPGAFGTGIPPGTGPKPGDSSNANAAPPVQIKHLLLRFVDVDVEPGKTYEYRIRLRMLNPNFERPKEVANPAYANTKVLYSPWSQLRDTITIPPESYLYAVDPAEYRKKVEDEYGKERELRDRLQAKDNQAVVEMCHWLEQVRTDGGKREPVGAWVVADMPVGRGQYVGRKQYIKLPLWSSEANQYVLREVAEKVLTGKKEVPQPKGWLVDFTTKSVLVDFEGGHVVTRSAAGKSVTEDVGTEMLIVLPDGRLQVKSSLADEKDPNRTTITGDWDKWVKDVEKRKSPTEGKNGSDNPFDRPPGM